MALGIWTALSKISRNFSELGMKNQILKWFHIRNEIFSFFLAYVKHLAAVTHWTLSTFRRKKDLILFYINRTTLLTLVNKKILVKNSVFYFSFLFIIGGICTAEVLCFFGVQLFLLYNFLIQSHVSPCVRYNSCDNCNLRFWWDRDTENNPFLIAYALQKMN